MKYKEIYGDLFKVDNTYTLAHCISADCKMGAGIATEFANRYPKMKSKLLSSTLPLVTSAIYYNAGDDKHGVFNLITKEKYFHKPTREHFNKAIVNLKYMMIYHDIKKLAIPQIGLGLDRLNWKESSKYIQEVFSDTDIEILVCIK